MILKEVQVGNVKGVTIVELGNGDVKVGYTHSKEEKYVAVIFSNDEPKPIGTAHNTAGTTTNETPPQAMLSFTKVESIEVVERALNKAKIMLRNIKKP